MPDSNYIGATITSIDVATGLPLITVADGVTVTAIDSPSLGDVTVSDPAQSFAPNSQITIGANPYYNPNFTGDKNFLSDSQQTKLDGLPVNAQEVFFTPTISSPSIAATVDQGENISYRLMSTAGNSKFMITDAGGTGVVVNYENGVMFGGATAPAGTYTIKCRAGNVFGISNEFDLSWSVNAVGGGGGAQSNLILSSMMNPNYNVTFTPTTVAGRMHMNGTFDASDTSYKVFSYNAGSSYYVVMFKTGANLWIAFETATDPETLTDGAFVGETNGVIVTSVSNIQDGKSVPCDSDFNVDYS